MTSSHFGGVGDLSVNTACAASLASCLILNHNMAVDMKPIPELEQEKYDADEQVKIICLGDSAVGKSK